MTTIVFDTHSFIKKLTAVGFTESQAEVFADEHKKLIAGELATKRDLVELEMNLKRDLKEVEYRMTIRLGSMLVIAIGVVAALVKLL